MPWIQAHRQSLFLEFSNIRIATVASYSYAHGFPPEPHISGPMQLKQISVRPGHAERRNLELVEYAFRLRHVLVAGQVALQCAGQLPRCLLLVVRPRAHLGHALYKEFQVGATAGVRWQWHRRRRVA